MHLSVRVCSIFFASEIYRERAFFLIAKPGFNFFKAHVGQASLDSIWGGIAFHVLARTTQ